MSEIFFELSARKFERGANLKMRNKIHRFIIKAIDYFMIVLWLIGACAIDGVDNSMKLILAIMIIPVIWWAMRYFAENYTIAIEKVR